MNKKAVFNSLVDNMKRSHHAHDALSSLSTHGEPSQAGSLAHLASRSVISSISEAMQSWIISAKQVIPMSHLAQPKVAQKNGVASTGTGAGTPANPTLRVWWIRNSCLAFWGMWLGEAARCGHLGYSAMAMLTFSIERGLTCTVNGSIGKSRCYRRAYIDTLVVLEYNVTNHRITASR